MHAETATRPALLTGPMILQTERLSKAFGGVKAVDDVTINLPEGRTTALVGPNGAGKTTLFHLLSGYLQPTSGRISYRGDDVTKLASNRLALKGLSRTFQHVSVFRSLSPAENVLVGMDQFSTRRWWSRSGSRGSARQRRARTADLLELVGLSDIGDRRTDELSYGQAKLLDLASTLATEPDLLLLDEPAAGLNSAEKQQLARVVSRVSAGGVSVCVVEHDMDFVLSISDYMYVMNLGSLLAHGIPREVLRIDAVAEAYLGKSHE
ncbi:ABC transporter ATP-binding protein [Jatrophihabitans sp. DSM 45814]